MKVKRPDLSLLKKIFLVDLIKGLMLTFSYQRPSANYTEQYPKERPKIAERFRGAPRLNNDPVTGETLCIACNLCALACPGALHRSGMGARRRRQEGADDVHLRYVALHVLRSLRRCVSDALPGTDAGIRTEPVRTPGHEAGPAEAGRGRSAGGLYESRPMSVELVLFYIFAAIAVVSAIFVITQKNVVHSAVSLAATLLSVAGIFLTLHAEFLAGVQVIVYVGGILVLFVFVIMLIAVERVGHRTAVQPAVDSSRWSRPLLLIGEFAFVVCARKGFASFWPAGEAAAVGPWRDGNSQLVGVALYTDSICCRLKSHRSCCWWRSSDAVVLSQEKDAGGVSMVPTHHYLILGAALFTIGVIGVLTRRNIMIILMSIELMMNAVNINLIAFSGSPAAGRPVRCSQSLSLLSPRRKPRSDSGSSSRCSRTRKR